MNTPLHLGQPWALSSYVCRQCRHALTTTPKQPPLLSRRWTSSAPKLSNTNDNSEWLDNFNALADLENGAVGQDRPQELDGAGIEREGKGKRKSPSDPRSEKARKTEKRAAVRPSVRRYQEKRKFERRARRLLLRNTDDIVIPRPPQHGVENGTIYRAQGSEFTHSLETVLRGLTLGPRIPREDEAQLAFKDQSTATYSPANMVSFMQTHDGQPADEVNVPDGVVSESQRRAYSLKLDFGARRTTPALVEKLRETKYRPVWGGTTSDSALRSKPTAAHFERFRQADQVSPRPAISTAGQVKAWGLQGNMAEQQSTAELEEEEAEPSAPAVEPKPPTVEPKPPAVEPRPPAAKTMTRKPRATKAKSLENGEKKSLKDVMLRLNDSNSGVQKTARDEEQPDAEKEPAPESTPVPVIDADDIKSIETSQLEIKPLDIEQPVVPGLQYGLDRALFNPGIYQLQDPHSRVFNFDPYLQNIMPVTEFDFNSLKTYKTSSEDEALCDIAKEQGKKYIGSTSSMTGTLAHFHYMLSNWRDINFNMMSRSMPDKYATFTKINKAPNAIFLRWKNGTYAIDADKEYDSGNVLMMLGKSMELLLTKPREEFERHRKDSTRPITEEERSQPESYQYTTMGDFLMRSQLDAYDSRLPGNGTFDLKTRSVVSVRMNADDYEPMTGYEIHTVQGRWESYEREYYDMLRATMLKYMLQARMGRMDGIFVAYHNVKRVFGFQYLPMSEIDRALHGQIQPQLGDQEFKVSLEMMNQVLEMATKKFPETTLRLHFETQPPSEAPTAHMTVFAEPMEEEEVDQIQGKAKAKIVEYERMMGVEPPEGSDSPEMPKTVKPKISTQYASSTADADPEFISKIAAQEEQSLKPIFMATILPYNYVKRKDEPESAWAPCEGNRPTNLTSDHEWKVTYIMKESEIATADKWAMYEDCKRRRKATFSEFRSDDVNDEDEAPAKEESGYITFLKSLSSKGAEFRELMDKLEAGKEKIVVNMAPAEKTVAGNSAVPAEEKIEDVDGYLKWLYK